MNSNTSNISARRKRKRKPTSSGRFVGSTVAYEIGLVRMAIDVQREFIINEIRNKENLKDRK
jgi:hypothetical protein